MTQPKQTKIPEDWEVVKLGDVILDIGDGGTPFTKIKEYFSGKIPWVNIEDIKRDIYDTRRHLSESGLKNSSAKLWPEGTIIFSFGASIGKVGIARVKLCTKQGIAGIVPNSSKIDSEFLYYVLVRESEKIKKIGQSMGSTIREVRPSKLVKLIIFGLPPLPEQKAIAQILSTVDKAIQKVDEIIAKTERLKKGLMQKLLTKGIGHKEFKDTEIGRIPKEWEVIKLNEITTKIKDIDHKMPKKEEIGVPFVSIKCMLKYPDLNFCLDSNDPDLEFISKEDYEYHAQRFNVERGDIIYSRFGSIGNAKLVMTDQPFIASYSIVLIKPDRRKVDSIFLTCVLNSERVRKQAKSATKGATNRNLHLEDIKNFRIPLPPIQEQQKIAEILSTIDKKLELERKRKEKLEKIKKGLMNDLLTGRKRVNVEKVLALGGENES